MSRKGRRDRRSAMGREARPVVVAVGAAATGGAKGLEQPLWLLVGHES